MRHILYGINYVFDYWLKGKTKPLICGIVLHNRCNLHCRHCHVIDRPGFVLKMEEVKNVIDEFYYQGGRCLYLEGGEPFIWRDKEFTMEDIVLYAKEKGYYAVIVYTNGTRPLQSAVDTIFVSIDGLAETNNQLRGSSFDRIMKNIRESNHHSIYINYTINSVNKDEIEKFCEYVDSIPQIRGTFFYFHTPYYGYDELFLDTQAKNEIIEKLINLKRNYKILNSTSGLKSALRNDWKKNLDICTVYENGNYYRCCRENNEGSVCDDCGYLSYAEIDQTLKLKPGAIRNALKYF